MPINKVVVQSIIDRIPGELRTAARKERRVLIEETRKNPIVASFMAAKGQIPFLNNTILREKLAEVNRQIATEYYAIVKEPIVEKAAYNNAEVIKASSIL